MSIQTFSKIGEDNYVVVFRSLLSENSKGYPQMAERMKKLVSQQEGFLEFSSAREGVLGITVSYWKNLAAIKKWKENLEHLAAQKKGKEKWYSAYSIQVCKIEKDYFNMFLLHLFVSKLYRHSF